jgi:hypothetical protein
MKTLKKLLATVCLTVLTINLNAQTASWTLGTNVATLSPATANMGIGNAPKSNAKLRLYNSVNSTDTVFGLHTDVANISSSSTKPVYGIYSTNANASSSGTLYGAYFKNTRSNNSGGSSTPIYGIYLDNNNASYLGSTYGVYSSTKASGYVKSIYGFYSNNLYNGSYIGSLYGVYSNNTLRSSNGEVYGAYLKNTRASSSSTGSPNTMYGIYSANIDSSAYGSVYGAYMSNTKTGGGTGDVYGIYSVNNNGSAAGSTYGAYFTAKAGTNGSATAYGIYSSVTGGATGKRYAGYFTGGNVVVMNGKLGIGKETPQYDLDVAGVIHASEIVTDQIFISGQSSGSFQVKGSFNNFYPVIFSDSRWINKEVTTLELSRFDVHTDASWRGSLFGKFSFHVSNWGHSSHFIDVDLFQYLPDGTAMPFIAGWEDLSINNDNRQIVIWLRGGETTYYFRSNGSQQPKVYDGVQNSLPFQNSGGGSYTFKTAVDPVVNSKGMNLQHNLYTLGENNYFKGNVGIGTPNPYYKLDVDGKIRAREVIVNLNNGADYVFDDSYDLMNLNDLGNYVKTNRHLPDVAPAAEMESEGINVSEMSALLLRKVEELTLYMIELKKENNVLKSRIEALEK